MITLRSCKEHSLTVNLLFNGEANVTPPTPFVMRCALRVAPSGFFIVRVRLGDKFGKGSVHLHIVRNEQPAVAQPRPELPKFPQHVPVAVGAIVHEHIDR